MPERFEDFPYRIPEPYRPPLDEGEREPKAEEAERQISAPSRLLFSPSLIEDVNYRISEKRASLDLRTNVKPKIDDFLDFATNRGSIKELSDLHDLSLENRIELVIAYEEQKREEKENFDQKIKQTDVRAREGLRRVRLGGEIPYVSKFKKSKERSPMRVALFIPTEKRREEIVERLPRPLSQKIKKGEIELTCFSDINDFRNRNRVLSEGESREFDLAIDSGVKVYTEVNLKDGVTESRMGIESRSDMQARQDVAENYTAIFNFSGGMIDSYVAVPGRDYLRTIDDRALPLLEEIDKKKRIIYLAKEKVFNAAARRHLLLLGALDKDGQVTDIGKGILDISKILGCSSQSARIIFEAVKRGMPADAILADYLSRHEKPVPDGKVSPAAFQLHPSTSEQWNKFLIRNDSEEILRFLSNEHVKFEERSIRLQGILGTLDDKTARSLIGLVEDLSRLYAGRADDSGGDSQLNKLAGIKIKDGADDKVLRLLITGFAPNIIKVQANFGPMLREAEVSLIRPISGEVISKDDSHSVDGQKSRAERIPYFEITLNNRRLRQPKQFQEYAKGRYSDPIVRVINRETDNESLNIIGPFLSITPDLLKEISPEAWAEFEIWYKEEKAKREALIAKNDPNAIAGPADLTSLKDAFDKKNPFG